MKLLKDQRKLLSVLQLQAAAARMEIFFAGADWKVEVFEDEHEGPAIYFTCEVTDTYNRPDLVELRILSYLSPNDRLSVEHFADYVLWRLKRVAVHEVGEGFKLGGKLVWDPHDVVEPGGKLGVA